jgi:hypothetical protein
MNLATAVTMKKQTLPASQVPSPAIRVELRHSNGTVVGVAAASDTDPTATFTSVVDGTYTVAAMRISTEGQPMGDVAVSDPVDVVNMHEVDVPGTVTVTLS